MAIKWYQSKILWAGVGTALLGIIPIVAVFLNVVLPTSARVINAAAEMVMGVLIIVLRVGTTDRYIV